MKNIEYWRKEADENLRDAILHRIKNNPEARLYEGDGYILYTIGIDTGDTHLNGGLCLDDNRAREMVERAEEFFGEDNLSYSFWVRDHGNPKLEKILRDKGHKPTREPGSAVMIIFEAIKSVEIPQGYRIKELEDDKDLVDFRKVIQDSFDKEEEVAERMFLSKDIVRNEFVRSFLIYEGDEPVSAAITVLSPRVGGIYYVGTLESQRGRGIGSYIVRASTNEGFRAGKEAVILQASELGESVYKKLGYKTISHYRTYKIVDRTNS